MERIVGVLIIAGIVIAGDHAMASFWDWLNPQSFFEKFFAVTFLFVPTMIGNLIMGFIGLAIAVGDDG